MNFDVDEIRQHLFYDVKREKRHLESFRINLTNQFIGGLKMAYTQLIEGL